MELVSVVVATYRRKMELRNALESLAKQTYPNIEILLVDDNGDSEWNNNVAEIVETLHKEYPEILLKHIVNQPNRGSAISRNIGIQSAKGYYVTFLDDDDIYLPDKIHKQVSFMESTKSDYSITDLKLYNEDGKEIDRRVRSYIKDTSIQSLRIYHLKYHMTGTDTMMFTKKYLIEIGGFAPIDVGDEFYLMQRAIEGGGKFGYLPGCEIKAYVHKGEGGLSSGEGKIKGENVLYEYKKTFFHQLDFSTKCYIKMRHYAVLAFAYYRMKNYIGLIRFGFLAIISSPLNCFKMLIESQKGE